MATYQVTVTVDTPRPLADVPMMVQVEGGKPPVLVIDSVRDYAEEDVAIEYVARFFGPSFREVKVNEGVMYV